MPRAYQIGNAIVGDEKSCTCVIFLLAGQVVDADLDCPEKLTRYKLNG
jgi:hypothetical protein